MAQEKTQEKKEIFYVTSNIGKFEEVERIIKQQAPHIVLKPFTADIPEIQTMDQKEVALDKAKKAWDLVQKPLIIDDAGIYFEKYNKFPGVLSKFVSHGLGFEGIKKLIEPGDKAFYLLYMIYVDAPDKFQVFEGRCEGVLDTPEVFDAHQNLPYDTYFTPIGADKTCAQMRHDLEKYQDYFYRVRALRKFLDWYGK